MEVQLQLDYRGQTRSQYRRGRCPARSDEVRQGQSTEKEVQLKSDHSGQTRSPYRRGRCPVRSQRSDKVRVHRRRSSSSRITATDEVTVQKREVSSQVTEVRRGHRAEEVQLQSDHRGQMSSQYRRGRCPVRPHEVRRGYIADETEVQFQSDHRGQTRSQYRKGRCPVRSHEVR